MALDASLYALDEQEAAFFKQQTGIADDTALKDHILAVQKQAYDVYRLPIPPASRAR